MTDQKINLFDLNRQAMQSFFAQLGEKAFRGDQVFKWIHQSGVTDFAQMSNLGKVLRQRLIETAEFKLPQFQSEHISKDGTCKWLTQLEDGGSVETVFIPEKTRGTLCVSSQVGCALNCSFCSTGKQGFSRNLTVAEIIAQVWLAKNRLQEIFQDRDRAITNVVMMGMGEPLMNFDAVVAAMDIMMDDLAYGLSKYRVTLSTSGVIPEMKKLRELSPAALAVSLHAPNNALRNQLVPLNKKYPLEQLMAVCKDYFVGQNKRVVTFEYVMLDNVNDTKECAEQLVKLLRDVPCKVNLIPFNTFPLTEYKTSKPEAIRYFQQHLQKARIQVNVRKTRGDDIDGACGQLVGDFKDRTTRNAKWLRDRKVIPIVQEFVRT